MITVHPSTREILRQPGYLYWAATSLSTEAGWGTLLGFLEKGLRIIPGYMARTLSGEEGIPIIKLFLGDVPKVVAILKNWNTAVVARAFPGFTSTTKIQSPSSVYTGADISSSTYANRLLFVPEDGGIDQNIFLAQLAAPSVSDGGEYVMATNEDTTLTVQFDLFRKGTGSEAYRTYYTGPIAGAALIT